MFKLIRSRQIVVFFTCLFASLVCFAIDSIELFIDEISIARLLSPSTTPETKSKLPLKLDQLSIKLDLLAKPVKLQIDLAKLDLPEPYKKMSKLDISCHDFLLTQTKVNCTKGRLSFSGLFKGTSAQQKTSADFSLDYNSHNDELNLSVQNINIGVGKLSFNYHLANNKWQTDFSAKKLDYKLFSSFINHYLQQEDKTDIINKLSQFKAIVNVSGEASGLLAANTESQGRLDAIKLKGQFTDVYYQFGDDLAEKLAFDFRFNLTQSANKKTAEGSGNYRISLAVDAKKGEIIQNDIYMVLNGQERLRTDFNYRNNNTINFSRFDITSKGFFDFKSKAKLLLNNELLIHQLDSQIDINNLAAFNQAYLNNVLSGGDYEELQLEGGIFATIKKNRDKLNIKSQFKDVSLSFIEEISLIDLNGQINWNNYPQKSNPVSPSQLSWQELTLNHLPFGATSLSFIFHNGNLQLTEETDIPIFDGAVHINNLKISQLFPQLNSQSDAQNEQNKKGLNLTIDGFIKPVSLGLLSSHFDWPLLDGTLSAVIPATSYNEKYLSVGGALMLQVFDGVIIVKDLKIVEPLKDYAQLYANIDLNNLDLKSLTKTYNFGEINGRLEGKFSGLELSAWEPVAFDAYIRTPKNDDSSHRISQRAIDNLSSLGGASGLLSRSFLSFFETFRYDKIGLSCKLKNNICQMSGVEAKGNSYYIVKGGGIPRIDVMGFQRQVNWQVLTSRLKAIQRANEAVIE